MVIKDKKMGIDKNKSPVIVFYDNDIALLDVKMRHAREARARAAVRGWRACLERSCARAARTLLPEPRTLDTYSTVINNINKYQQVTK